MGNRLGKNEFRSYEIDVQQVAPSLVCGDMGTQYLS
jgi:hypothetical protein